MIRRQKNGFSLIELIVVVTIIALISAIVLVNYRGGQERFALQRSTHILAQDMRHAQELAMRAENFHGTVSRGGFGVHLVSNTSSYILFADCDGDRVFDVTTDFTTECANSGRTGFGVRSEELEIRQLERGVIITSISPASPSTIVFIPPDPAILINNGVVTSTTITLGIMIDGVNVTSSVIVNNAGLIAIE